MFEPFCALNLPEAFEKRMNTLLGDGYGDFIEAYSKPPRKSLRVNLLKCAPEHFKKITPFVLEPLPFAPEGFFVPEEINGRHPWHHAGVFYFQEASAMSAVTALDPQPGERVLDLCAAPGGKSTQIAGRLKGQGLLVSNEIIPSRAKILLSNIERMGVRNAAVTCEQPERLCTALRGFFDRVLVDAPCSGEGMFRREPVALTEWRPELPEACANRQLAILQSAKKAVKGGGLLVYSTCTFSPEENEGVVDAFLKENPDFEIEEIPFDFGRPASPEWAGASSELAKARRILPQDGGEGHFVARLRRKNGTVAGNIPLFKAKADKVAKDAFFNFYQGQFAGEPYGQIAQIGENLLLLPPELPDFGALRLHLLRAGVLAGRVTGASIPTRCAGGKETLRFEPEHALYMAAQGDEVLNRADLPLGSPQLGAFLHGEQIEAPEGTSAGYGALLAEGFVTGFFKCSGSALKNHYPKGLRNL